MTKIANILNLLDKDIENFMIDFQGSSAYEYEKEFKKLMDNYSKQLLQTICKENDTKQRDTRKVKTVYGEIRVDKSHPLSECPMNFGISAFLQEHMCRIGSKITFKESEEEFKNLLGINLNAKQIERVCHKYGELLNQVNWEQSYRDSVQLSMCYPEAEYLYCEVDGSMIFTREKGWKEIKLGRIFYTEDNVRISTERNEITSSVYCAHLGTAHEFWEKFSEEIPVNKKLIFINDGARWIWNYIQDCYPNAVQILDYYHYKKHIYDFAKVWFNQDKVRVKQFTDEITEYLFNDDITGFFKQLNELKTNVKKKEKELEKLINYLEVNRSRIRYGHFSKQGFLIGSGAIEAAHRDIIQKRLKLSGQRWTIKGAQQIANLRVVKKSDRWESHLLPYFNNKMAA